MILLNNLKILAPFILALAVPLSRSTADISIILFALAFLAKSYLDDNWHWTNEKWFKAALVFFIYCVFINSSLSINSFESLKYSLFFLRWPLFAVACAYWIFTDLKSIKIFFAVIAIVVIFLIIDTWYQFFLGFDIFGREIYGSDRLTGPFRRPYVGMWITKLILFPLFIFVLFDKYQKYLNSKFFYIFLTIFVCLFFSTIFITGERMALIMSLLSIIIIMLGLNFSKYISFSKSILIFFLLILISIFFLIVSPDQFDRSIHSSLFKIINWKNSDYGLVWRSAYDVWMESPFFGAGLHQYRDACAQLGIYGNVDQPISGGVCFHPHNISMQLLSETGFIGFSLFFIMVLYISLNILENGFNKKEWLTFFLMLNVIVATFLPIQSNTDFFSNKYSSIVWLLIGVSLAVKRLKINQKKPKYGKNQDK